MITQRKTCRVCGRSDLEPILSLGNQYSVSFPDDPDESAVSAPLDLVLCNSSNGGCGLLQLLHTLDHDILYKKYWYKSGISTTMVSALQDIVDVAEKIIPLKENDIVVDIGSNDGTMLRQFKTPGVITVGFEPNNLWELGKEGNSKIIHDYFNHESFSQEFGDRKAKIITSIAMFYDLEHPNEFVADIKACLDKNGLWVIQMNYLGLMIENNTFDNISHEHLEYYSLFSLENLLKRHNMKIIDIEINDVNGGSFRLFVKPKDGEVTPLAGAEERLQKQREYEKEMKFDNKEIYDQFAERIKNVKNDLRDFLEKEKEKGKKIFIYGASTRGLVVLQYADITNKLIDAAVDMNPDKKGKHIVGTGIKIMSIEEYRKEMPDYLFVLPYHFLAEIKEQEQEYLQRGGKIVVAIPKFEVQGE